MSGPAVHRVLPRCTVQPPVPRPRRARQPHLMDTTARHFSIMPPTPLPTQPFSYVAGDATGYDGRRSDKTAPRHAERETPRAGKDIQRKISFACNAIMMNSTIFCTASLGPLVGVPAAMYAPPLGYKREALAVHRTVFSDGHKLSRSRGGGNTIHSGRRVLRSGGPNHSKSCCVHCVLEGDRSRLANPRVYTL